MDFEDYYRSCFPEDLDTLRDWARKNRVSHKEDVEGVFSVQPNLIQKHRSEVAAMKLERLELLGATLYLTILLDQVCYTHFRAFYRRFQEVTRYPKLRGDCPGGCQHLDPSHVLSLLADSRGLKPKPDFLRRIREANEPMRRCVLKLIAENIVGMDSASFWSAVARYLGSSITVDDPTANSGAAT